MPSARGRDARDRRCPEPYGIRLCRSWLAGLGSTARERHGWERQGLRLPCGICCQRPNEEITFHESTASSNHISSRPALRSGATWRLPPPPSSAASACAFFLTSSQSLQNARFPVRNLRASHSGAAQSLGTTTPPHVRRGQWTPVQAFGHLFTAPDIPRTPRWTHERGNKLSARLKRPLHCIHDRLGNFLHPSPGTRWSKFHNPPAMANALVPLVRWNHSRNFVCCQSTEKARYADAPGVQVTRRRTDVLPDVAPHDLAWQIICQKHADRTASRYQF